MRVRLQELVQSLALVAASLLSIQPALSDAPAEPLPLRLETRGDFTRLSFSWRRSVDYDVARRGNTLTVDFARVASIAGSEAAMRSELIVAVSPRRRDGHTTVILTLVPDARVRHFRRELDVVIDILPPLHKPVPKVRRRSLAAAPGAATATLR